VAEFASFLPLLAIVALFWLLVIRPASKRQKTMSRMQSSLEPGMRVMLSSGIFGTIRTIADDRVRVEIAPHTEIEVVRGAIGSVVTSDHVVGGETDGPAPTDERPDQP
jgi:preprotein translocase subunit YajC